MQSREKIRIAYAGSNTYNQLTSGSWFCNRVTNTSGNHSERGFLGGALYNENWEPTDTFCFQDFSVEGLVAGDANSDKTRVQLNENTLQDKSSLILKDFAPISFFSPRLEARLFIVADNPCP